MPTLYRIIVNTVNDEPQTIKESFNENVIKRELPQMQRTYCKQNVFALLKIINKPCLNH